MVAVAVLKLGTSNLRETERLGKGCIKIVTDEMKGMLLQISNEFTGKVVFTVHLVTEETIYRVRSTWGDLFCSNVR